VKEIENQIDSFITSSNYFLFEKFVLFKREGEKERERERGGDGEDEFFKNI